MGAGSLFTHTPPTRDQTEPHINSACIRRECHGTLPGGGRGQRSSPHTSQGTTGLPQGEKESRTKNFIPV